MTAAAITNDFHTLDYAGQVARWDALAARALAHFGHADAPRTLVSYTNNAIYRVEMTSGIYALRLHRPGAKSRTRIEAELTWLRHLSRQDGFAVPVPVPVAPLYAGRLEGVAQPVYGILFRWLDGETRDSQRLTPADFERIGALIAHLHQHSRRFTPPAAFDRPALDFEGLFGTRSPYQPGLEGEALITSAQRRIIQQATERIRDTMAALDANRTQSFGMIHADLIAKNLLWRQDESGQSVVAVIDFDDCAFGYYLYDLAPLLLYSKHEPDYHERRNAIWNGYRRHPDSFRADFDIAGFETLEALVAARHIASIRWIAGNLGNPAIRDRAPEIITTRVGALEHFLTTGEL